MNYAHSGTAQEVLEYFRTPEAARALYLAKLIKDGKGSIWDHETFVLHHFARACNRPGARMLEIGTLVGFSALVLAEAAPQAEIFTLNPAEHEVIQAQRNLASYPNVRVLQTTSWDYLPEYDGMPIDLIFVDGDHKHCAQDVPWWEHLWAGGWMLFHDFDANSPGVIRAVDALCERLGRPLDLDIRPSDCPRGFVGLRKREGE